MFRYASWGFIQNLTIMYEIKRGGGERMQMATDRLRMLLIYTFIFLIAFVWVDELIDMPCFTSGSQPTPINWVEALIETMVIAAVGFLTVTRFFFKGRSKEPPRISKGRTVYLDDGIMFVSGVVLHGMAE